MFLLHSEQSLHAGLSLFLSLSWYFLPMTILAPGWVGQSFPFLTCNWYFSWSWYPSSGWLPTSSSQLPLCEAHRSPRPLDHQTWYGRALHRRYMTPQSHRLCSPAGCCHERRDHLELLMQRRFPSLQVVQKTSENPAGHQPGTHLNTLMNWEVMSCGRSSFTSATLPSRPSMLRCSSCFSGNSWPGKEQD